MTVPAAERAVILGGARTPIGRYGGALSRIRTDELLGLALTGACDASRRRTGRCRGDRRRRGERRA